MNGNLEHYVICDVRMKICVCMTIVQLSSRFEICECVNTLHKDNILGNEMAKVIKDILIITVVALNKLRRENGILKRNS